MNLMTKEVKHVEFQHVWTETHEEDSEGVEKDETKWNEGRKGDHSQKWKNMCGQRAAGRGWPYQFEICHHSVSWNGFGNLLIVPGMQRKKEEQKYLEVRIDKVRASTQNISCFCRLSKFLENYVTRSGGERWGFWPVADFEWHPGEWDSWHGSALGTWARCLENGFSIVFTKHQGHTMPYIYQDISGHPECHNLIVTI